MIKQNSDSNYFPDLTGTAATNVKTGLPHQQHQVRQREVDAAMTVLSDEIDLLAKTIAEVEERLRMVLLPEQDKDCGGTELAMPYACALASSICSNTSYIRANRERLENLLTNLQL